MTGSEREESHAVGIDRQIEDGLNLVKPVLEFVHVVLFSPVLKDYRAIETSKELLSAAYCTKVLKLIPESQQLAGVKPEFFVIVVARLRMNPAERRELASCPPRQSICRPYKWVGGNPIIQPERLTILTRRKSSRESRQRLEIRHL